MSKKTTVLIYLGMAILFPCLTLLCISVFGDLMVLVGIADGFFDLSPAALAITAVGSVIGGVMFITGAKS